MRPILFQSKQFSSSLAIVSINEQFWGNNLFLKAGEKAFLAAGTTARLIPSVVLLFDLAVGVRSEWQ